MDKKAVILDIAMNLTRVGNWAADNYLLKKKRIVVFLDQTDNLIASVKPRLFPSPFKDTYARFLAEYPQLEQEGRKGPKDRLWWAERMMTWGNILTHRAKLIA